MSNFFSGWRRKTGCVALIAALVCVVLWFRGCFRSDQIQLSLQRRAVWVLELSRGSVEVSYRWLDETIPPQVTMMNSHVLLDWQTSNWVSSDSDYLPHFGYPSWSSDVAVPMSGHYMYLRIPLLMATTILAIAAAYLILLKPRTKEP